MEKFPVCSSNNTPLEINLLNVQGLTHAKWLELESFITFSSILCITETHQKIFKFNIPDKILHIHSFRKEGDKKGGGLSILMKEGKGRKMEKISTNHRDILHAKCTVRSFSFSLILIYLASDDNDRNDQIDIELLRILNGIQESPFVLLGDFNGHIGFLGLQPVNKNGNRILDWMITFNLILLNGDANCSGEITWHSRGIDSAIDFVFVNNLMYDKYINMHIDENKEKFDLSDHNMVSVYFNIFFGSPKLF